MDDEQDWTAEYIVPGKWYVVYDETGQILGWYETRKEAKEVLIEYAKTLKH